MIWIERIEYYRPIYPLFSLWKTLRNVSWKREKYVIGQLVEMNNRIDGGTEATFLNGTPKLHICKSKGLNNGFPFKRAPFFSGKKKKNFFQSKRANLFVYYRWHTHTHTQEDDIYTIRIEYYENSWH